MLRKAVPEDDAADLAAIRVVVNGSSVTLIGQAAVEVLSSTRSVTTEASRRGPPAGAGLPPC